MNKELLNKVELFEIEYDSEIALAIGRDLAIDDMKQLENDLLEIISMMEYLVNTELTTEEENRFYEEALEIFLQLEVA